MAAPLGTENPGLEQQSSPDALALVRKRFFDEPWTFEFFQAVRLLERMAPEKSPVGRFANPADEAVRFSVNPSLMFPPSPIHSLDKMGSPPLMSVNFFGLTGTLGALPNFMSELVSQRFMEHLERQVLAPGELGAIVDRIAARDVDPYSAANDLLRRALK